VNAAAHIAALSGVPMEYGLVLAAVLFVIGLGGLLIRRNLIIMLAAIEVMLNASGLAFVVAGAHWGKADGQVMFIFILAMAAAEVSVGLAIALRFRQLLGRLNVDDADRMRG
jgi:NADH-quinone oxidoreductase subunit K